MYKLWSDILDLRRGETAKNRAPWRKSATVQHSGMLWPEICTREKERKKYCLL